MVWREKEHAAEHNHSELPPPNYDGETLTLDPETQKLHDKILSELQEVTANYVNIPNPIESAARRQRVLEGEMENLMARRAASMLAGAL